jgi:hypothetical protein
MKTLLHTFQALALAMLLGLSSLAAAQGLTPQFDSNSAPLVGGVGLPPPTQLPRFSGQSTIAQIHTGPTGKACITIAGYAQQQLINKNIFDHMITASNDCSQPIKIQVCYYQSHNCTSINVPGYGRKEALLGIMPAMSGFRFEYKEQFDSNSVFGGAGIHLY